MALFSFYVEYEDRVLHSLGNQQPDATIEATNIFNAAKMFTKKMNMKLVNYESLLDTGYRVYCRRKKGLFKAPEDYVYFVKSVYEPEPVDTSTTRTSRRRF